MDVFPSPTAPESAAAILRVVLFGLRAALGLFGLEAARAVALHRRIGQVAGRIERLLMRFRAGKLWRVTGRTSARSGAIRGRANCTLPRRFGWLVISGGHRAAGFGSQLQTVLAAPEMAELLAASPQAARILRPICRALAVELPLAVASPGPVAERTPKPPRRRKSKPKPEPFRIPLPRGVLSAARRQGYGKLC
jgi:hypothetical protein